MMKHWPLPCIRTRQMLPTSHRAPTISFPRGGPEPAEAASLVLAEAFSDFIAASGRLEASYRDLQREVTQLDSELAVRNAALEGSLRENEQMRLALVALVDSMPCGVLVLGAENRILCMNPEARRLLGRQPNLSAIDPAQQTEQTATTLLPIGTLEGLSEFRLPATPERDARWLQLRTRRLAGGPNGMEAIVVLSDISAQKESELKRESGRHELALAAIAATLAHEMRNPLASLELFLGLLEEEPQRTQEWLAHLRAGLRGMAATVDNVLSFHGIGFPLLRPVALGPLLAATGKFVLPITQQAGLRLVVTGHTLAGTVMANEAALQQVLLNLVTNAVRHTSSGGTITLRLSQPRPTHLRLEVRDSGCGIAPEQLPLLFRAGWSAGGERSGLGLAVCQKIAIQHGTQMQVVSTPGRGARFALELSVMEMPVR